MVSRGQFRFSNWVLIGCLLLFLGSCTGNPPKLEQVVTEYLYFINNSTPLLTHLYITLQVTDPDGIDDIDYVSLRHPGRDVSWTIPFSDVQAQTTDNRSSITLPLIGYVPFGSEPPSGIPGGTYELTVVDLAGESDVQNIIPVHLRQSDLENLGIPLDSTVSSLRTREIGEDLAWLWLVSGNRLVEAIDLSEHEWYTRIQDVSYSKKYLVQRVDLPGVWIYSLVSQ